MLQILAPVQKVLKLQQFKDYDILKIYKYKKKR